MTKKIVLGSLATLALAVGLLVRFGALASGPAGTSVVTVNMPAAQALNLSVNGSGTLGAANSQDGSDAVLGAVVHNTQETFDAGIAVNGAEVISSAGGIKVGTLRVGGTTGATMDRITHGTVTLDPASISAGGSTTTAMTVSGASVGDHCGVTSPSGDLLSTTSTAVLQCRFTAANTATVYFNNTTSTATFNAATSVLDVVGFSY